MDRNSNHMHTQHSNASATRNRWHTALAALALGFTATALVGCGGGEEESGGTDPAPAANGASAATPTPSTSGTDSVDAAPDADPDENPRATVDGTLSLFITAMEEGEFNQAVELVDPTTDLHTELLGVIESVDAAAALDDPNAVDISNMIRRTFSLPFAGADYEIVSEDEARARAVITRPGANNDQHTLDLNRVDGAWFILAGRDLIRSAGSPPPAPRTPRPTR